MPDKKRILIVRTDRLGDVVLSTPVIENVRAAYPNAYIAFMCRPYTKEVLYGNPYLDDIVVYDKHGKYKTLLATLDFALWLRSQKYDIAIILHPTNRVHLITFVAGIKTRVGWNRKLGFLLTKRVKHLKNLGLKHEVDYSEELLTELGIKTVSRTLYFPVLDKAVERISRIFNARHVSEHDTLLVINPFASCPSKCWSIDNFIKVIELLRQDLTFKVIIVGDKDPNKITDRFKDIPDVIDMVGMLSISELGALLKRANVFISNDSGPVHIASALDTPVISIFGRNDPGLSPKRWGPLGENSVYLHRDVGCVKCSAHECTKGYLCLKAVSPDKVASTALEILYSPKRRIREVRE
jgi:lipopolysaccharide heptosyltransferase II